MIEAEAMSRHAVNPEAGQLAAGGAELLEATGGVRP